MPTVRPLKKDQTRVHFFSGMVAHRLTLIEPARVFDGRGQRRAWLCMCSCGKLKRVPLGEVGRTKSCGCAMVDAGRAVGATRKRHGMASHIRGKTPTWRSWRNMRCRCNNPNDSRAEHYSGRGITICDRWSVFENFLADMGERPDGKTLDRINNDGNYEPSNCRWATPLEQARNRHRSK